MILSQWKMLRPPIKYAIVGGVVGFVAILYVVCSILYIFFLEDIFKFRPQTEALPWALLGLLFAFVFFVVCVIVGFIVGFLRILFIQRKRR